VSNRIEVPFAQVADIVRAGFPSAKSSRTVKVETAERYHVSDYWSEGSRTYCAFVKLDTLQAIPGTSLPSEARQQNANPFNLAIGTIEMQPGYAVVEHSIFRGKDLGFRIYLHASNIAPLLAAPPPAASEKELRVLVAFRSLKSGPYRKEALDRIGYNDAMRDELAKRGLLKVAANGATAITAEGRAACANESLRMY
jgi:hypothetical protein